MLIGRDLEAAAIDHLLEDARAGRSGVLVVRGEAGIGKSMLLDYAIERADGMRVLAGVGIESEAELAYAALHQILRPVADRIDRLPELHAAALRAAFALSDETLDERFRVMLGVLGLLAEAAEERPLLCVIDDAQWLDQASAEALVFAARRLEAERLVLLFAARDEPDPAFAPPGLRELRLSALEPPDARALLAERLGREVAPEAVEWVLASANGNPLALVELPGALTPAQLAGREPFVGRIPPATSVEQAYLDRVALLPSATRDVLLLAATEETGDRGTVQRAAGELGLSSDALAPAERQGLLQVRGSRLEFRHPLVRSAVYRGAGFAERERAHRTLAAVLTGSADADRRAWHRAAATVGTDEEVARELERSAERARARSGHAAASAALERAAGLTPDGPERGRRLVGAARAASLAGLDERASALAGRAAGLVDDPLLRAEIARIFGVGELQRGRPAHAFRLLLDAAREIAPSDTEKAVELLSHGGIAAGLSGEVDSREVYDVAQALAGASLAEPWGTIVQIMSGVHAAFEGDVARCGELIEDVREEIDSSTEPLLLIWSGLGAIPLGDDVRATESLGRAAAVARASGSLGILALALGLRSPRSFVEGRLDEAAVDAAEAVRLAREIGAANLMPHPLAVAASVAALRGNEEEARAQAEEAIALAASHGIGLATATGTWTIGLLELVHGRYAQALDHLNGLRQRRRGFGVPVVAILTIPDRVEAAVRAGRREQAESELASYARWVDQSRPPWAFARLAACRALLADGEEATRHFEDALRHGADARPFELARIRLLYGEHLRRNRRRSESREQLRAALATFEQMGTVLWADRARSELRATGETARKRDPSTIDQLTPQELQIARLVAEGKPNKEVAAELFLSPRTVEYHLRKVFAKLGITSRTELVRQGVGATRVPAAVA